MIQALLPRLPRLVICLPILAAVLGVGELFAGATVKVAWRDLFRRAVEYEREFDCDEAAQGMYAQIQRHAPPSIVAESPETCEIWDRSKKRHDPTPAPAPQPPPKKRGPAAPLLAEELTGGRGHGFPAGSQLDLLYTNTIAGQLQSKGGHSGLPRLAHVVKQHRERGGTTLLFDTGNLLSRMHSCREERRYAARTEARTMLEATAYLGPDAMVPGRGDAALGVQWLAEQAAELNLPYVCANLTDLDGEEVFTPWRAIGVGDQMVGVFGITKRSLRSPGYEVTDIVHATRKSVRALHQLGCQLIICLSNQGWVEDLELVQTVPGIDLVVGAGGSSYSHPAAAAGATPTLMLWPRIGGHYVGRTRIQFLEQGRGFYPEELAKLAIEERESLTDPAMLRSTEQAAPDSPVGNRQRWEWERIEREWAMSGAAEITAEGRHLLTVDTIELDRNIQEDAEFKALLDEQDAPESPPN